MSEAGKADYIVTGDKGGFSRSIATKPRGLFPRAILLHYSHDFVESSFAMADEFVLTPAAWLQPASLFTPTPKAAQRVLEFSARRSITITRARLVSTPRAAFRTGAMRGHRPAPRLRSQKHFRKISVEWIGQWGLFSRCGGS
jgi:hypothetical protein